MAKAYASTIVDAPVEQVWPLVRAFDGLMDWGLGVTECSIEEGRVADDVGCIRNFRLGDGTLVRERLLALDDSRYRFVYNFETPAFPVENYRAVFELIPVTNGNGTFAQWWAEFDESPDDKGKYVDIISRDVFANGLNHLHERLRNGAGSGALSDRWQGLRPAKVFCSSVLDAGPEAVWREMRDFAGMDGWHPDITDMTMLEGVPSSKISGVRDFLFGEGRLWEQLTLLDDEKREFRYRILKSEMPWMNYHAGARLYPVTDRDATFAVWTADWVASPNDDVDLIPTVHNNVFQKAFDTLNEKLQGRKR